MTIGPKDDATVQTVLIAIGLLICGYPLWLAVMYRVAKTVIGG